MILVCMDSFKDALAAEAACEAVKVGLLETNPNASVRCMPMADGGEGTAHTLLRARPGGEWIPCRVMGPLPDPHRTKVDAGFAWFPDTRTAVVEMASASGLPLLTFPERDPLRTTTHGTGELIANATRHGALELLLAVGGSATVDAGVGMAVALGWEALDGSGQRVPLGGGNLIDIYQLVPPSTPNRLPTIRVLCDVDNPLTGPRGAAPVFAPQKGADEDAVAHLARGLEHIANLWAAQLDRELRDAPGGGAAGGIAAGAIAFLDATLEPGAETLMDTVGLDAALADATLVITGEGRFDETSLHGKVVSGVLRRARAADVPVAVLAGSVGLKEPAWKEAGVATARPISPPGLDLVQALRETESRLRETARELAQAAPLLG